MSDSKSVVIIGAGIGGIATAVYLAKNGYEVKVYEKNSFPGGRCGQIIHDGHRFDLGATMLLMPTIYRKVFESLGLNFEDYLEVKPLNNIYKIYFDDGAEIAFTTDDIKMRSQLEKIESGSFRNFQTFVSRGYEFFQLSLYKLIARNFYNLFEFVNLKNVWLLFRLKIYISQYTYTRRFFKHTHLKMAFTFQNIYVGQSPFKSPALFAMLPSAELTEGSFFPAGGMYSIIDKLLSTARDLGVQFYYNKPVSKIKINNNEARSIILDDGNEINADIIVANADLPYVYRELLPDKNISLRIDHLKFSCSAIVFHWGLDKIYPLLEHHSVFLSDEYRASLDSIFMEKSLNDKPCFYIHAPVRSDPSAAPPNQDSISVIVPVGHLDEKYNQDWNKLKHIARSSVIDRLIKMGMKDIEKHIKFEICYLPNSWKTIYNISKGSVFGSVNHNIMQMGYFRPHNRHNRYHNFYFVGGSTHPGSGIPLVLLSAKLTSERILKEVNKL
jgi:phytoene desaturase